MGVDGIGVICQNNSQEYQESGYASFYTTLYRS